MGNIPHYSSHLAVKPTKNIKKVHFIALFVAYNKFNCIFADK